MAVEDGGVGRVTIGCSGNRRAFEPEPGLIHRSQACRVKEPQVRECVRVCDAGVSSKTLFCLSGNPVVYVVSRPTQSQNGGAAAAVFLVVGSFPVPLMPPVLRSVTVCADCPCSGAITV